MMTLIGVPRLLAINVNRIPIGRFHFGCTRSQFPHPRHNHVRLLRGAVYPPSPLLENRREVLHRTKQVHEESLLNEPERQLLILRLLFRQRVRGCDLAVMKCAWFRVSLLRGSIDRDQPESHGKAELPFEIIH